jgi:hypothetical protein
VAVTGAEAAAKKKAKAVAKGPARIARGCTYVQAPYCLGVSTSKGTYSLWNANPWIPPGTAVDVWGTPSGPGMCGRDGNPGHVLEGEQDHQVQGLSVAARRFSANQF